MTPVRALVCDFGGVLTTPLAGAFAAWAAEHDVPLEALGGGMADVGERRGENPLHALERGELSEREFLAELGAAVGARLSREVDLSDFGDAWFAHLDVNEELLERLRRWRAGGLRLALCTNNVREWEPRWRAMLPVDELFEVVVDSAFVGARKPEPAIYAAVLEGLGDVEPAECLLLDDFEVNCDGAREAGMRAVWFRSNEQALAEVERILAYAAEAA